MPKVSILIPVYNAQRYIEKCLRSILRQTYADLEIICISDGSKDESVSIIKGLMKCHPQIQLYEFENHGVSWARNKALDLATGDYVMFVDSDDSIKETMVDDMLVYAIENDCDIVTCGYYMCFGFLPIPCTGASTQVISNMDALGMLVQNEGISNYPWTKLIRRHCFDGVRFDEDAHLFEDTLTIYQTFMKARRVGILSKRYYNYVYHRGSLTNHMTLEDVYDMRQVFITQYRAVKKVYPDMALSIDKNLYNSDMMILFTLLSYTSKKDAPYYDPSRFDFSKLCWIYRLAYYALRGMVNIKFGWTKKEIG